MLNEYLKSAESKYDIRFNFDHDMLRIRVVPRGVNIEDYMQECALDGSCLADEDAILNAVKKLVEKFESKPVNANTCVHCGRIIPEGRWDCPLCEK